MKYCGGCYSYFMQQVWDKNCPACGRDDNSYRKYLEQMRQAYVNFYGKGGMIPKCPYCGNGLGLLYS